MKLLQNVIFIIGLLPLTCSIEIMATEEEITTGYFVLLENKTALPLKGTLYLMLINNNKIPFTIAPGEVFSIYAGKLSDRLTAEEKAISDIAGQIVGVAVDLTGMYFGVKIPEPVIEAIKKVPQVIINTTNTCISGFDFVYKNKRYEYQFGNGCKSQWYSFRPSNFNTELAVYDINEVSHSWGNVTRVSPATSSSSTAPTVPELPAA